MTDDKTEVLVGKPTKPSNKTLARMEDIFDVTESGKTIEQEFRSAKRIGQIVLILVFGIFGMWAAFWPIDSAAHAQGQVTVKSFKKPVQHLEGGIIKEVRVRDGDHVNAGDIVVVLDDTQARSQLGVLTTQFKAKLALESRLIAERDNKNTVTYPDELSRDDREALAEIASQDRQFATRRLALSTETQVNQHKVDELQVRIPGIEGNRDSKARLVAQLDEEIKDQQSLLKDGFADKNHLRDLERMRSLYTGEVADLTSSLASAKYQINEAKLVVQQLQNKMQAEVAAQLSDAQTQVKDLRERIRALTDTVARTQVRAPDSGEINNLKVHTPGTVIPAGIILAEIVPQSDELIVEAKVSPMDIDRVKEGQPAKIHMSALNSRKVPNLTGKVLTISPDAIVEPNGQGTFYLARLELGPNTREDLKGEILVPGMPAEIFITTGSRTFLQYLLEPLSDSMSRVFKED